MLFALQKDESAEAGLNGIWTEYSCEVLACFVSFSKKKYDRLKKVAEFNMRNQKGEVGF